MKELWKNSFVLLAKVSFCCQMNLRIDYRFCCYDHFFRIKLSLVLYPLLRSVNLAAAYALLVDSSSEHTVNITYIKKRDILVLEV